MQKYLVFLSITAVLIFSRCLAAQQPTRIRHVVAAMEEGRFHGWPANNGAWQWGDEFLVGLTQGDFAFSDGHNIAGIQESVFTRSIDGGQTWTMFDPKDFLDDDNVKWLPKGKKHLVTPINFTHRGFAMRVFATGYHGNDDPEGGFYYSYDRGRTWNGPFYLGDVNSDPELAGAILTSRTDYVVMGRHECMVFISAREVGGVGAHRVGCIKTVDGGLSFDFVSWITPSTDEYRAIMPCTVQLAPGEFVTAFRKINVDKSVLESAIDAHYSRDRGQSWRYLSTVKQIRFNSNPPALLDLADGRLCCVYGDRDVGRIAGKYSTDDGKTWGPEFTIRGGYLSSDDWADMGYPRLLQRSDGKLVAIYYWASDEHPQHYIAASIWKP